MSYILKEYCGVENTDEELEPLLKLVWDYPTRDHHNYDEMKFYFKWHFYESEYAGHTDVYGIPVYMDDKDKTETPVANLRCTIKDKDKIHWRRALALRKAVYYLSALRKFPYNHLKTEWDEEKLHSECW